MPLPINYTERLVADIYRLYSQAAYDLATMGIDAGSYEADKMFTFSDYVHLSGKVQKRLLTLADRVTRIITNGVAHTWLVAEQENDTLVKSLFGKNPPERIKTAYLQRNLDALKTFQTRKVEGLGLSDRVWKYVSPLSSDMELAIDYALANGTSAKQLAKDTKQYLLEPDKLFRRVRDERGVLQLSKATKNYHPGQGVYRSSFKNAARMTRTETNMAYHSADQNRWADMDFVVGYEVKRSNNPYYCPMCDALKGRYPKTFVFSGWHPQCRCSRVSILASAEEIDKLTDMILDDEDTDSFRSTHEVTSLPDGYGTWIEENKKKLLTAKSVPYFVKNNYKGGKVASGLRVGV